MLAAERKEARHGQRKRLLKRRGKGYELRMNTDLEKSLSIQLDDTEATVAFGARLGDLILDHGLRAVLLFGRLGCGKTTLTRGIVSELPGGFRAEVSSPSFTLCNIYPTKPPVAHCDLYRGEETVPMPEEAQDVLDAPQGLVIVEWAERLEVRDRPANRLDIRLIPCQNGRLVTLCPHGEAARRLVAELSQ